MPTAKPTNWWPSAKCAKAFWGQQDVRPYKQLLADTLDWADPRPGERWLDLGCGGGGITRALWERTGGKVGGVVGLDCAAANEAAYQSLRDALRPDPPERIRFVHHDFSTGLELFASEAFDNAVSGLSISYAEHFDESASRWTTRAYDHLLREVHRVIRPGGRFVFSVNVPNPSWGRVALHSLGSLFLTERPLRAIKRAWRMMRYGRWLKREARTGRFHYLPAGEVSRKLTDAGFVGIAHRLSYCNQSYVFRANKPLSRG